MKRRERYLISKLAHHFRVPESVVREALTLCGYPTCGDLVYLPVGGFPMKVYDEIRQVAAECRRVMARASKK